MTEAPRHDFDRSRPVLGRRGFAVGLVGLVLAVLGWLALRGRSDGLGPVAHGAVVQSSVVAPGDTVVVVRLAHRPRAGTLHITRGEEAQRITATMTGGDPDDELLVFGTEVRIVNGEHSGAHYEVRVPASVARGEVRVGAAVVARPQLDSSGWVLELAP